LPELYWPNITKGYNSLQLSSFWHYTPHFKQDYWFKVDHWDHIFTENELGFEARNSWNFNDINTNVLLRQGYEFSNHNYIHPLKKINHNKHGLTPCKIDINISSSTFKTILSYDFDIQHQKPLRFFTTAGITVQQFKLDVGYLFTNQETMKIQNLSTDIPHFLNLTTTIPMKKGLFLHYSGMLYANTSETIFNFKNIQSLAQFIKFEYKGHCWGCSLGFEEKHYKELGITKKDQTFVFSLKIDLLGSVSKKLKTPEPINKN
jgi:hypothetical protein